MKVYVEDIVINLVAAFLFRKPDMCETALP
jgi:hypothetical protein